ncbi:MAG: phosphatidate cytidylyltransferase [Rickettsiales bacterium]
MAYQSKSNFIMRLISACILAPLVILIIKLSGFYFTSMILVAAIIMGGEWTKMTKDKSLLWQCFGILYIGLPCLSLLWIEQQNSILNETVKFNGVNTIISIFVIVWANDIGGYIFGRLFGGKKLCPKISPNKTWSGFFGGVICSMLISPILLENMAIAGIIAIVASVGDLLESWIKRKCDTKDSGSLIPGHGGLLDRVDGILLVAVIVAASALYNQ